MVPPLRDVIDYQTALGVLWVETAVVVTVAFCAALDPRPDLSVRARTVNAPYSWWW